MDNTSKHWANRFGAFLAFAVVAFGMVRGCSYTVDDFPKYTRHVNGQSPNTMIFKVEHSKVRDDFVEYYDDMVVKANAREYLNIEYDPTTGDKVVDELRRLKMLAVWREGNRLVISIFFLNHHGPDGSNSLNDFAEKLKDYTDDNAKVEKSELQKGLFSAMRSLFDSVEVRGSSETTSIVLPMPFYAKNEFRNP